MNTLLSQDAATPLDDSTRLIPLTQGQFAIVDAADYEWLNQWKWYATKPTNVWYAARKYNRSKLYMHRVILPAIPAIEIDHKDGDGLNNRRSNLRSASRQQNQCNRPVQRNSKSGIKGVSWDKARGKWEVSISANRKRVYRQWFDTKELAATAYSIEASRIHGKFSRL